MLNRDHSCMRSAICSIVTVLVLSSSSEGCDSDKRQGNCSANVADAECLDRLVKHEGFEIGMSKQAALKNACDLAVQSKIWNPVFLMNGSLRAHPGISICDLESEAYASDQWSFIEKARLRERYIQLRFADNKVVLIRLLRRGWDP